MCPTFGNKAQTAVEVYGISSEAGLFSSVFSTWTAPLVI